MKKQKPFGRGHGILMPIFSLHSDYGIGTLGEPSRAFVDFVSRAEGYMWQMLPLGPTGYGDSPYQSFSAFAGNPYFIDPLWIYEKGWITKSEFEAFKAPNTGSVDYGYLYKTRKKQLFCAFKGFERSAHTKERSDYEEFCRKQSYWLETHAVFSALKSKFGMLGRESFERYSLRSSEAMEYAGKNLSENIRFACFLEYVFSMQWQELKVYAANKKVMLVGDIPLYVSGDSSDVWAHPELFVLDQHGRPTNVAGVPPDMFSKEGQLWGNPLYKWVEHEKTDFEWWRQRIARQAELFDVIRIDHFIGICRYYSVPAGSENAKKGEWLEGPGKKLTDLFLNENREVKFIAEDLGAVTNEVKKLIDHTGFPGMKLMQFAFDGEDNPNLTHNIKENCVVYPGTHDNNTLNGFFNTCNVKIRKNARRYLNVKRNNDLPDAVIRECFRSAANTVIIPLADYLGLDDTARINTPSVEGGNWKWRTVSQPDNMMADEIAALSEIYKRKVKNDPKNH